MSTSIAMVPVSKGARLSLHEIQHQFVSLWPRLPRPIEPNKSDNTVSFNVGGSVVYFALMPGSIPINDLNAICDRSWLWPEAKKSLADQRGHIVISVKSHESALNQVKFASLATAALLTSCSNSLGVYWCGGNLVISPEMFCEFCVKMLPDSLPLYIWIDFRVARQTNGRAVGYTTGLSQFGLMEIETLTSHEEPGKLRERMFSLAVYMIENGLTFKNGDTVGEGEHEKITVVYSDSSFGNPKKVIRLDYESTDKAARKH